jgi:hypothetical protein
MKYGKLPPETHAKTLLLDKYVPAPTAEVLPSPEAVRGWELLAAITAWGMLGNDTVGDCVIAAILHFIMMIEAIAGNPITFTTEQAIALYSAITGYDPSQTDANGNNPTDQGTSWTAALAYWLKNGIYGYKILGWASFDYKDPLKIDQAIDLFGAALVGTAVTASMETQFSEGQPWNAPFTGGVQGLHGIPNTGYGHVGRSHVTWGATQKEDLTMPTNWDEAYVVITPGWLAKANQTPLGIDLATLQADLAAIQD